MLFPRLSAARAILIFASSSLLILLIAGNSLAATDSLTDHPRHSARSDGSTRSARDGKRAAVNRRVTSTFSAPPKKGSRRRHSRRTKAGAHYSFSLAPVAHYGSASFDRHVGMGSIGSIRITDLQSAQDVSGESSLVIPARFASVAKERFPHSSDAIPLNDGGTALTSPMADGDQIHEHSRNTVQSGTPISLSTQDVTALISAGLTSLEKALDPVSNAVAQPHEFVAIDLRQSRRRDRSRGRDSLRGSRFDRLEFNVARPLGTEAVFGATWRSSFHGRVVAGTQLQGPNRRRPPNNRGRYRRDLVATASRALRAVRISRLAFVGISISRPEEHTAMQPDY